MKAIWAPGPFDMTRFRKIDEDAIPIRAAWLSVSVEHDGKRGLSSRALPEDYAAAVDCPTFRDAAGGVMKPLLAELRSVL